MPVGLYPRESADILAAQPDQGTSAPPQPGVFTNFGTGTQALLEGVAEGGAKVLEAGETAVATGVQKLLSPVYERQFQFGAMGGVVPETPPVAEDPEVSKRHAETAARAVVQQFQLDPHVVGFAGQTLHGISSGLSRFGAGSLFGGPVGGAVTVGGTEGVDTANMLRDQGVDDNTANALGAANALFAGGASMLPGGYGKSLLMRLTTGAGANTLSGFTQRGLTHNVLDAAGYTAQAQQYKALDGQAMMADAVLGTAFGAAHHIFTPSTIDAAHTIADADHFETSTPGTAVPATPAARDAHVANMTAAAEALLRGDDLPPLQDVEMVPNPDAARAGQARADAVGEVAAEVAGEPVARPAAPEVERRADAIESARLSELRAKRTDGTMTEAEKDELLTLQERDRLAAKVGGRRIQGVQTDEAYSEMLARGEAKPVQGFVDMDMLKALNDTLGHGAGDDAIRTLGSTLAHYFGEGNVFRRSSSGAGDEFVVQHADQASYDAAIEAARQHLSNHTIRAYDADGNLIGEQKGIGFSHGSGKTVELAEQAAYADKQLRAKQGLRRDRPADTGGVPAKPAAAGGANRNPQAAGTKAGGKVSSSWVIREKATGKVILETFDKKKVDALNTAKYEAVPIKDYLTSLNRDVKATSAVKAVAQLSAALKRLEETDGSDDAAHTGARAVLQSAADAGLDVDSIERAAAERVGGNAERLLAQVKASERASVDVGSLDPGTREAVTQAQAILERRGDVPVKDENGVETTGRGALASAVDELKQSQGEGELHRVAAACFGRG